MRFLMMLISVAMLGTGLFTFANSTVTFISVAFIVGIVFIMLGVCEVIIDVKASFDRTDRIEGMTADGLVATVLGFVFLTGQIPDDNAAFVIFASWMVIEGMQRATSFSLKGENRARKQGNLLIIGTIMSILGIYMFFNKSLFNIPSMVLIGASIILIGLRRFRLAFDIQYGKPLYITSYQERLDIALEQERVAMEKAKEGVKESKIAHQLVESIKKDMVEERKMINETNTHRVKREDRKK